MCAIRIRAENRVGELLKELSTTKTPGARTDITSPRDGDRSHPSPYAQARREDAAAESCLATPLPTCCPRARGCGFIESGINATFDGGQSPHRRHLGESQRAMLAAKLADLDKGSNQHRSIDLSTTQSQAAEMLNVSTRSVGSVGVSRPHRSTATTLLTGMALTLAPWRGSHGRKRLNLKTKGGG